MGLHVFSSVVTYLSHRVILVFLDFKETVKLKVVYDIDHYNFCFLHDTVMEKLKKWCKI